MLVGLYEEPEKPNNAIEYISITNPRFIKKFLGAPTDIDTEKLQVEYEKLREENLELQKQVAELKKELETVKPSDD